MIPLRCFAVSSGVLALAVAALAQTVSNTWTGGAVTITKGTGTADASASGNWAGGNAPVSDANTTVLNFGASPGLTFQDMLNVTVPGSFEVRGIVFAPPIPFYQFLGGTLGIGRDGVTVNGNGRGAVTLYSDLVLLAHQTWTLNGSAYIYGPLSETTPSKLTVTGDGYGLLVLDNGGSTFSGGVDLQAGTLFLGGSSTKDEGGITRGPAGTGTLTLHDNTALRTNTGSDVTLHNNIHLGNNVVIGDPDDHSGFTLAGNLTPQSAATSLYLGSDDAVFISGAIGDAIGSNGPTVTSLTFRTPGPYYGRLGFAVLTGQNTYSGGTIADHAAVIFYAPGSLPATGAIGAVNGGYVATGYSGGMTDILSRITDPATFDGALGFDTNPDLTTTPTVFSDDLDLSAFLPDSTPTAGFWGLGTETFATLTGHITPPTGGNFVFGGGEGKLFVRSDLGAAPATAPVGVRVRTEYGERPLTVWLQGNNSFTGNLLSDHSLVVLDSSHALPANTGYSLDSGAYVGYTENFTAGGTAPVTPAQFIARLAADAYDTDSILGFDSATPAGRTITDPIDLSGFEGIFIGTTTQVRLQGVITAPSASQLSVTGLNGGRLTLDTPLLTGNLTSLQVGAIGSDAHRRGIVEFASGASNYAGGTTLGSGYLLLAASSTVNGTGTLTTGPLGTGSLTLNSYYDWEEPAALVAASSHVTLHNNLSFTSGILQLGVPVTNDREHLASGLQSYTSNRLTLAGNLSGNAYHLAFAGNGRFDLGGENSGLHAYFSIGKSSTAGTPLVVAQTNTALGNPTSSLNLGAGADLLFTSVAPVIGSIEGGSTDHLDTNNRSHLLLSPGATLTIHQYLDGELGANIGGGGEGFNYGGTTSLPTTAALVKNGAGTLILSGQSTYSGGTTLNAGTIVAGSQAVLDNQGQLVSGPLGTGSVTLAGGSLGLAHGFTLHNPLIIASPGSIIGGHGTFNVPVTIGSGTMLAPGNSPGILTFANGLTWSSGGALSLDILNLTGTPGADFDQVLHTGGLFSFTATAQNPFFISLNSLSTSDTYGPLASLPLTPVSLVIFQSGSSLLGAGLTANLDGLHLNTSGFASPGNFSLSLGAGDTQLLLNFSPAAVPEPSTCALLGFGLLAVFGTAWRKNRSRRT